MTSDRKRLGAPLGEREVELMRAALRALDRGDHARNTFSELVLLAIGRENSGDRGPSLSDPESALDNSASATRERECDASASKEFARF